MTDADAFHLYWPIALSATGIIFILKSSRIGSAAKAVGWLDFETEADRERVVRAAARRDELDRVPSYWGIVMWGAPERLAAVIFEIGALLAYMIWVKSKRSAFAELAV
jgi:hypothetical protein